MKRMGILLILTFFYLNTSESIFTPDSEVDWSFKKIIEKIYKISSADTSLPAKLVIPAYGIAMAESNFDSTGYNKSEGAAGLMQIREIMRKEANRITGYEKFNPEDRFYFSYSIKMFGTVQKYHSITDRLNLKAICAIWNKGDKDTLNPMVRKYYKKVVLHIKNAGLYKYLN